MSAEQATSVLHQAEADRRADGEASDDRVRFTASDEDNEEEEHEEDEMEVQMQAWRDHYWDHVDIPPGV